jgi:hypothetical protein
MQNNINNKRERDAKNIIITLRKEGGMYSYLGDSLTESRKIIIPLNEVAVGENLKTFSNEDQDTKREKSERGPRKNSNIINLPTPSNLNQQHEELKVGIFHENTSSSFGKQEPVLQTQPKPEIIEEIPMLAKLVDKNFKQQLIIPSCSQWFSLDSIHDIEVKALPEFFCGKYPSKSPEIYKEYRNYIINLYRENTNSYLSATSNNK